LFIPLKKAVTGLKFLHSLVVLQRETAWIYEKLGENKIISIPVHKNQDLKIGTLKALMKIAELTEDDL